MIFGKVLVVTVAVFSLLHVGLSQCGDPQVSKFSKCVTELGQKCFGSCLRKGNIRGIVKCLMARAGRKAACSATAVAACAAEVGTKNTFKCQKLSLLNADGCLSKEHCCQRKKACEGRTSPVACGRPDPCKKEQGGKGSGRGSGSKAPACARLESPCKCLLISRFTGSAVCFFSKPGCCSITDFSQCPAMIAGLLCDESARSGKLKCTASCCAREDVSQCVKECSEKWNPRLARCQDIDRKRSDIPSCARGQKQIQCA